MNFRTFGKTNWQISEIGCGMWGLADWTGGSDKESEEALDRAVDLGCNFFDTAWAYGGGKSEQILGRLIKRHPGKKLYVATKIPPKNFKWPSKREYSLDECFPPDHIREYVEKSLRNLDAPVDLIQFHVWEDGWADDTRWQEAVASLKKQGKIKAAGISINRWEPDNGLDTIRTGLIESVQVIYNIFDQSPEDLLFPLCKEQEIAVIARVPFDEGTLAGVITLDTKFPANDWRGTYFVPENLKASVEHAERLKKIIPAQMTLPETALRFILSNPVVSTTIPGMRKTKHVESNIAAGNKGPLDEKMLGELKKHRWDRKPTTWSQ
ncbi:MAG TPA: aldo/keto reductase [Chitinivibrionales bacterium]|nr:aldo/keto reductase [Chitinivibrionales bacterium]